jgi:2'-5' RNA ligase
MPRLFTGLEIPFDVGQSLSLLRGGLPGARWIDPENYHVTLRFIGDVDDVIAHEVASMLGRVRREAFELRVDDLKSFGGLFGGACAVSLAAVQGLALRAVLVAGVDRRRALRGRGGVSARGLTPRRASTGVRTRPV